MAGRKRYALLVGQADEEYQRHFIEGFSAGAFRDGADTCVFSMFRKYQDSEIREAAEANIFSLVRPELFDGIVILKDSLQTPNVAERIEDRLHESFRRPVLVIDQNSRYFETVMTDGYGPTYELVEHLIEKHGFTDIAYLSGKKWHVHARQRLQAYKDAMHAHGLEVRKDRIVYGDFWYDSGELCVELLLKSKKGLPQAVACANDCMAIGLCKALTDRDYRVPEDVSVVGFDSSEEGRKSPKPITSCILPAKENGEYAADWMRAKLSGEEPPAYTAKAVFFSGESCGCEVKRKSAYDPENRRKEWGTEISEEGFYSVFNSFLPNLMGETTLSGFIHTVYTYLYQLKEVEAFYLCLTEPWKDMEKKTDIYSPHDGYSEKMIRAIRYRRGRTDNADGLGEYFDTAILLPELERRRKKPMNFFFSPLFFEDRCFGYTVLSYGDKPRSYDEVYRVWMNQMACSLENVRLRSTLRLLEEQIRPANKFGFDGNEEFFTEEQKQEYRLVKTILDQNLLQYYFQPVVRAEDGSIFSFEALMRSATERKISPLKIIRYAGMMNRLSDVEKATFENILAIVDEGREVFRGRKVFINSIPGVSVDGETAEAVNRLLERNAETVVVELTEEAELSDSQLEETKKRYQTIGVEIAVDDYGTGYSNISNLLRYMPNYVKIDRSLLSDIQNKPAKQHFVREIIEFCHENKIMALAEGVETREELQMVIHLGTDLIQGYYTGRPMPDAVSEIDDKVRREIVAFKQEQMDGRKKHIYSAGRTNRVTLNSLVRDGFTDIAVGEGNPVYKDISVIGTPGLKTDIHMLISPGYEGRITLENVYFANVKNRPCIEIGRDARVTLVLKGDNRFYNGGIQVPPGASLVVEGEGNLSMELNAPKCYGIGNHPEEGHGEIIMDQDGEIHIMSKGRSGICIGSGLGGRIEIHRGKYLLEGNGDFCVGVGSMTGSDPIVISTCLMEMDISSTESVGIGSLKGSTDVFVEKSTVNCSVGGTHIVGIGTREGQEASLRVENANLILNQRAIEMTFIGAICGKTTLDMKHSKLTLEGGGTKVVAVGSPEQEGRGADAAGEREKSTEIHLENVDVKVDVHSELGVMTYASPEDVNVKYGRQSFRLNGEEKGGFVW